jgi:tetratricopeptide (TPR) repeat protein
VDLLLQQTEPLMAEGKWPEALAVARQASGMLATGGVPAELRRRVGEVLADAAMVVRLEDIHLAQAELKDGALDRETPARLYAAAFRDYGIDVEALEPAEALERIRQRAIRDHLAAVLEEWAGLKVAPAFQERLLALAEQASSEDYRGELRAARGTKDRPALQKLADSMDVRQRPPLALLQWSMALKRADNGELALRFLRRAQQQHPGDFWLNVTLGQAYMHQKPPQLGEAVRFYTAALALRSQNPAPYVDLGVALEKMGHLDEAIAQYEKALRLQPRQAVAHYNLGNALKAKGRVDDAVTHFEQALRFDPSNAGAHVSLGAALADKKQLDAALDHYRQALQMDPKQAVAHYNRGLVLLRKNRHDDAVAAFQEAIRLQPDFAQAHNFLGLVLYQRQRLDEAGAAFQEAVRIKPDYVEALLHLGIVFTSRNRLDEAIAAYRAVLRLEPNNPTAHVSLGIALEDKGLLDEAIAEYREGLRLQPDSADAHLVFAEALRKTGKFTESLAAVRRGRALALKGKSESPELARQVRAAERLVELDGKLPAVLRGTAKPAGAAECIELADLCTIKRLPGAAAHFFAEAFAAQPSLAEDLKTSHRYNAACVAALAGCYQGQDDPVLNEHTRAAWRRQALAWLRADLGRWTQQLSSNKTEDRAAARRALEHWQGDPDLAGLREQAALAKLPDAERQAWQQLWATVQQALSSPAGAATPPG